MSDGEFEINDELERISLDNEKEDSSNLDEYGVWVKGSSDALDKEDGVSDEIDKSFDISSDSLLAQDSDAQAFDFDGLSEDISIEEDNPLEKSEGNVSEESDMSKSDSNDSSFDDIDMSDFFTDFDAEANAEVDEKEDETSIKMDLNFDTVDSYTGKNEEDDFDAMLDASNIEDVSLGSDTASSSIASNEDEIDDLLSDLNSSSAIIEDSGDQDSPDIELNIDVDETQDFAKLSGDSEDASICISLPSTGNVDTEQMKETEDKEDGIVVKNTVVEPENMDDIIEKNRQALGEDIDESHSVEQTIQASTDHSNSNEKNFDDVEALAKELTENSPSIPANVVTKVSSSGTISVAGLDKITELLQDMTQELVCIREDIASLKSSVSHFSTSTKSHELDEESSYKENDSEESGFFKDEDTDEAIALTGDELNNILITADFTEETTDEGKSEDGRLENFKSEDETVEEPVASLEASVDDEINFDEESNFEDNEDNALNFDDITLENSKLDDFVIPEELDYNMLNLESANNNIDDAPEKAEGTDMSYLDENDSSIPTEGEEQEVPESQEVPVCSDSNVSFQEEETSFTTENKTDLPIEKDELPSNIKRDIKSVLSYMDQLLESLPEDKLKEFAESEYFEMYNRLFNELGIS